jgi:hypothetical protein
MDNLNLKAARILSFADSMAAAACGLNTIQGYDVFIESRQKLKDKLYEEFVAKKSD